MITENDEAILNTNFVDIFNLCNVFTIEIAYIALGCSMSLVCQNDVLANGFSIYSIRLSDKSDSDALIFPQSLRFVQLIFGENQIIEINALQI